MAFAFEATSEPVYDDPSDAGKSKPAWQASEVLRLRSEVARHQKVIDQAKGEMRELRRLNGAFALRIDQVTEIQAFADQRAAELAAMRDDYATAELRLTEMTDTLAGLRAHLAAEQARAEQLSQDVLVTTQALATHASERAAEQATWAAEWAAERSALLAERDARQEAYAGERGAAETRAQAQQEDNARVSAALREAEEEASKQRKRADDAEGVLSEERAGLAQAIHDVTRQLDEHRAESARTADSTRARHAALEAERDHWRHRHAAVTESVVWRLSGPLRRLLAKPGQP